MDRYIMAMYDDESDSDKPDENQIELVKKLHREMADRRIIVNMKNKIKNKKRNRNLTSQIYQSQIQQSTSSGSDPDQKATLSRRTKSLPRSNRGKTKEVLNTQKPNEYDSSDSTDEYSLGSDDLKQKAELNSVRNQMAVARVTNTESKLAEFNSKLNQRKDKLEELHIKLKIRKERLIEREERLRIFEKVIAEKESQIKRRNDSLMKKETDLETFAKVLTGKENLMYDYEKSLNDRAKNLEYKEKQYGVQVGQTGGYEKCHKMSPKPILSMEQKPKIKKIEQKRISWADSAISSSASSGSPSENTSSDDDSIHKMSVSQRLKRFEKLKT